MNKQLTEPGIKELTIVFFQAERLCCDYDFINWL